MRTRWSKLADTLAEVEAVGDTRDDARALVVTLANKLAKNKAMTLGATRGYAHELVDTLADMLEEEESVGDTWGDAYALADTLAKTR